MSSDSNRPNRPSRVGRRGFFRGFGGLAALSLAGCKIEPILDLPPSRVDLPLMFPDMPPQIPDQLEDAETTLRAMTDELLDYELPLLASGALRVRPSEDQKAVAHLRERMLSFGLEPAGNRGGWLQPVPLDIVEPTGDEPRITLRPESEALVSAGPTDESPQSKPPADPESDDPKSADPDDPDDPDDPESDDPPKPKPKPTQTLPAAKRRALELASLGAFRQRGAAAPHQGLLVGPVRPFETPLPTVRFAGRIALLRAPKNFDLSAIEAPARVDMLFSAARDAGAIGCLLLTDGDELAVERFAQLWRRQVRRAGGLDQAMLIEGVLGAKGRKVVESATMGDEPWVLDVALATRDYKIESYNVLGRITGREYPDEAVVLTCAWDTPDPLSVEVDTLRLIATLAAFHQLAEWSRRSAPPRYSLVLLLTANAGFAAGESIHAAWAANSGAKTSVLLALDRPTTKPLPAVTLSGHFDASTAELVRGVLASDGRDLLLADQLSMSSLAPYLRYPAPVMTVGAPDPDALVDPEPSEAQDDDDDDDTEPVVDPREGIHADVRLLRNLVLALSARG